VNAVGASKRPDAATAVLAVLSSDQLSKARHVPGVIYSEDQGGSWAKLLGVNATRPVTLIVGLKGQVLWRKEGAVDNATLVAALQKFLVKTAPITLGMLRSNLRLGQSAPNFLLQYAPGRETTLRKLTGTPCTLVFWKSTSPVSIQAVLDLQKGRQKIANPTGGAAQVLLAVNYGEDPELARAVAAENGFSDALVLDSQREIAIAYGVTILPTTVYTDEAGVINGLRYGYGPKAVVDLAGQPVAGR
jgi:peroxiredoxin